MRQLLAEKLLMQAFAAEESGRHNEASKLFHQSLKHDGRNAYACQALARHYFIVRNYSAALVYARRLREIVGPDPEVLFRVADLHDRLEQHDAARAAWGELLASVPPRRRGRHGDLRRWGEHRLRALGSGYGGADPGAELEPRLGPGGRRRRTEESSPGQPGRTEHDTVRRVNGSPKTAAQPRAPATGTVRRPVEVLPLQVVPEPAAWALSTTGAGSLSGFRLRLEFEQIRLLSQYEDLLCLPRLNGVERFWYQVETVRRILRDFGGRVLLADEVGLGKTIEAGMAVQEYLLRGLARSVLVLVPPGLVGQWRDELASKFDLAFRTTDEMNGDPAFWSNDRIVASINVAKSAQHFSTVMDRDYDMVVVDEAHILRNRNTLNWKLVNALRKKYLLLLSATPVQNNLIELFNVITLLRPGTLKTESAFRREYMKGDDPREPANAGRLRDLLRTVMIRNTRSLVDVKLPRRIAATLVIEAPPAEREAYDAVSAFVRDAGSRTAGSRALLSTLLREAGSSPAAVRGTLERVEDPALRSLLERLAGIGETAKERRLLSLLEERRGDKTVVFTQFRATLNRLEGFLRGRGVSVSCYHGGLAAAEKAMVIRRFREDNEVLLSTESGGEGHNIQCAATLVNFDVPWNPMRIEQRIGRLHRIGQTRDIHVFNLCQKGTLEELLLDVLERKINMFELVVGEIDMILGQMDEESDFGEVVFDLWKDASGTEDARQRFNDLGERLVVARERYEDSRSLDESLFADEFGV